MPPKLQLNSKLQSFVKGAIAFLRAFLSSSNIHGFNHISNNRYHFLESSGWFILVAAAIYSAFTLSLVTWTRYRENPTVISLERDKFAWNTTFPGAVVCPLGRISEEALDAYVKKNGVGNKTELKEFLRSLAEAEYGTFHKVKHYNGISSDNYMEILIELRFKFNPFVTNSGDNKFQSKLNLVVLEMGICYEFNSQLSPYFSPNYWKSGNWKLYEPTPIFYVHPTDGDVSVNIVNMSSAAKFYPHGPYELADSASKPIVTKEGYLTQMYLTALTLYSTERARALSVAQRKCRYYNESNLPHSPVYSYVLCRMECRISLAKSLCGCIPHFYRKLKGEKTCDVIGLHCLANYTERLITLQGECSCLANCEETVYSVDDQNSRRWFLGSNLGWGMREYPTQRLKRDVIFGFTDLLVYFGGMAGLFLGCSVLSFVEAAYFLSVRLYWFVKHYKHGNDIRL